MIPPATQKDRDAYRAIVWARTCPFERCDLPGRECPYGIPGCPQMDWLMRFDELGWISIYERTR